MAGRISAEPDLAQHTAYFELVYCLEFVAMRQLTDAILKRTDLPTRTQETFLEAAHATMLERVLWRRLQVGSDDPRQAELIGQHDEVWRQRCDRYAYVPLTNSNDPRGTAMWRLAEQVFLSAGREAHEPEVMELARLLSLRFAPLEYDDRMRNVVALLPIGLRIDE